MLEQSVSSLPNSTEDYHGEDGLLYCGKCHTPKEAFFANALMEQEVPVRMTNFARILNELNNSFSGRNEVVDRLCRYPLLILDDFGMERGTEYALEQIYNIVDSRYRRRKPLIVTTNLTLDELRHPQDTAHARIYDRLLEMCVPISCIGISFRKETAQKKLERLKSLIE
ncbi:MAG: ATP-binding protein [Faecalibacterium sp.]